MNSLSTFRKPPTNKAMGIEIEALFPDRASLRPDARKHYGFFYVTTDGSINSYDHTPTSSVHRYWVGRELVSQPLSSVWLKKEIKKINRKYPWESNASCGIHIHVSRKWLTEEKAKKVYAFLRSLSTDDKCQLFGRGDNDYTSTIGTFGSSRYLAINTQNAATIEFRMFSSGSAEWACYCVDMATYLVEHWSTLNIEAILAFRALYPADLK